MPRLVLSSLCCFALVGLLASAAPAEEPKKLAPGRVEIDVEDLHCASCAKKVARKLYAVKGVRKVQTSVKKDLVVVFVPTNEPTPAARLWSAVEAGGTPPVELRYGTERLDAEAIKPLLAAIEQPEAVTR